MSKNRVPRLLEALESRLEALTEGLEQVDVTGKGIELVKEIKELHAILHNLQQGEADKASKNSSTITVVWGGMPGASSSPPRGKEVAKGRASASKARTHAKPVRAANTGTPLQTSPRSKNNDTPKNNDD